MSLVLFRLNGLWFWKNPLFFLSTFFSGGGGRAGSCFTGETFPLAGS